MDYDYPDPEPFGSVNPSRLPYFHIDGEDAEGQQDGIRFENVDAGASDEDDDDEEADGDLDDDGEPQIEGVPFANPFAKDGDTPFIPQAQASSSEEDDDSSSESEAPQQTDLGEGRREAARGRGRPRGRGRGGRRGGLAMLLRMTDPDRELKEQQKREARRRPRGRGVSRGEGMRGGRRGKRAARNQVEPSQEFRTLQAKATTAFLDRNFEDAADFAKQAVQINPEIFAAHSLLSQIYHEMGKKEESLGVLWSGAHTQRTPGVWWEVANRTIEMKYQNQQSTEDQLLYCYSQIVRLDNDDYDAHRGRMEIFIKRLNWNRSIRECSAMARIRPYELDTLQQLAELCIKGGEAKKAKVAYDKAIIHYRTLQLDEYGGEFSFSDLNIYLELFMHIKDWSGGLQAAKSVARWLCGRRAETFWDDREDDCEWDLEDEPRRSKVSGFKPGAHGSDSYGEALLPEIRAKMGIFRLRLGPKHLAEAMAHFELFYPEDDGPEATVYDYADLFRDIAGSLREQGHLKEALRFYEPLQRSQRVLEISIQKNMAECYHKTGQSDKAIELWEKIVKIEDSNVDILMELAKAFEAAGESAKAYKYLAQVMRLGRRDVIQKSGLKIAPPVVPPIEPSATKTPRAIAPKPAPAAQQNEEDSADEDDDVENDDDADDNILKKRKPRAERPRKPRKKKSEVTQEAKQDRARYLLSLHDRNEEIKDDMRTGDEEAMQEWLDNARILTDAFRAEKLFYPPDRYIQFLGYSAEARRRAYKPNDKSEIDVMADRLASTLGYDENSGNLNPVDESKFIPTSYHGIEFTAWLDLFCEYGLLHARDNDGPGCYAILDAAAGANVFYHDAAHFFHIHVSILQAALILLDEEKLYTTCRYFIKATPYATDTFRLWAALGRLYPSAPSWYNSGPSQKFIMRQLRQMDYALMTPEDRANFKFPAQTEATNAGATAVPTSADATPGNPHGLKTMEPVLLVLYGHFLATAASYTNALNYYLRAYAADRTNAMVILSTSVAYMQYSMKRQCENRQFCVMQGLGFLEEYKKVRMMGVEGECEELAGMSARRKVAVRAQRRMEVEFNEARWYHHLGLLHLAIPAYERCLAVEEPKLDPRLGGAGGDAHAMDVDIAGVGQEPMQDAGQIREDEDDGVDEEDFKMEAAYALQHIYALGGESKAARNITEKYLVI